MEEAKELQERNSPSPSVNMRRRSFFDALMSQKKYESEWLHGLDGTQLQAMGTLPLIPVSAELIHAQKKWFVVSKSF